MDLLYPYNPEHQLLGYANAGYLSDPYNGKSQIGYVFTHGDCAIS